jgi:selenocysteine lyase/cysteine desulfurase
MDDAALTARLRADTPACEGVVHFNNAGASLMPDPVWQAVTGYLAAERVQGGYEAEAALAPKLDRFYAAFAGMLGARPDEIAFAESATRAWHMVFYGMRWQAGDEVVIHVSDYGSNTLALRQMRERAGIVVHLCPSDPEGQIDTAALQRLIGPRTRLISLSHVPTQGGIVQPAAAVGAIARAAGVPYLLDACQSLGQVPVDVAAIGCDMLSGTGRKYLRGPRGTGVLYVRRSMLDRLDPPFIDGHAAAPAGEGFLWAEGARRFEAFEQNLAGKAGLAAAVDYALGFGIGRLSARLCALAAGLREALAALPGVLVRDQGAVRGGIVTFTRDGEPAAALSARLQSLGFNTSVSRAHWAPLDFAARGLPEMVRASVHAFNSEDEVAHFAAAVTGG